jgi:DNA polymerase delta subunit 3
MQGMSEDEDDAADEPEIVVDEAKNEAARSAREARQEKLRKMMEDDGMLERVRRVGQHPDTT